MRIDAAGFALACLLRSLLAQQWVCVLPRLGCFDFGSLSFVLPEFDVEFLKI